MTMRERMRKAWAEKRDEYAIYCPSGNKPCELVHEATDTTQVVGTREDCFRFLDDVCADAALAAMRTPTQNMAFAGVDVSQAPTVPADVWNAMIDAARNEEASDE